MEYGIKKIRARTLRGDFCTCTYISKPMTSCIILKKRQFVAELKRVKSIYHPVGNPQKWPKFADL